MESLDFLLRRFTALRRKPIEVSDEVLERPIRHI